MRKESLKIARAFAAGVSASAARTRTDGQAVYLHDNLIAVIEADKLRITAQGWATATTCDRLHAIAQHFTGSAVSRRKGRITVTRPDGTRSEHAADEWITLPRTDK
jgi:hypothetical protein